MKLRWPRDEYGQRRWVCGLWGCFLLLAWESVWLLFGFLGLKGN